MRTYLRSKVTLLFLAFAVAIFAISGTAMALVTDTSGNTAPAPTIQSDKADYAPGSTVNLSGSGWQSGESVHIVVNDTYGATWKHDVYVTADASGNVTDSFPLPDYFVSDYDVTATGAQSGMATTTFTDGNAASVSGTVKDSVTGAGIPNATVTCDTSPGSGCNGTFTATTNSTGNYVFSAATSNQINFAGSSATLSLKVTAAGYANGTISLGTVSNGNNLTGKDVALTPTTKKLTVTKSGAGTGTVTSSPAGINCSPTCSANFNNGTIVTLTAAPGTNSTFNGWSGDATGTTTSTTVTMNADKSVSALFKANQTISFTSTKPTNAVYGDTYTPTANGGGSSNSVTFGASGACSYNSGVVTMTSTGTCTVTADQAGNADYNAANQASQVFSVGQRSVTVTPDSGQGKVYGDSDPDPLTYKVTSGSLVTGDSFSGKLGRAAGENVGTYEIQKGTLSAGTNYDLTVASGVNFTITARKITVTADSGQGKVYGDSDPDPLTYKVTSGSLVTGDSLSGKLDRAAGENVGTYAIQKGTLSAGTNYDLTFVGANFTITARKITVTPDSGQGKVYGDSDPTPLTYKVTNGSLLTGDSLGGSLARAAGENVGTYAIQQGTLSAPNSNYELTFGTGVNFTITTAPITIKANDASRYYDQSNPTFGYTVVSGSFKFNDDTNGGVTVNLTTTATPTSPAGTYPITVALNGTKAGNYNLSQANPKGTLTITAWTNQGFFAPVDYSNTENSVKGGSTVPLKFRVFEGTQQITNTAFVSGLKPVVTNCLTGVPIDDIEELATGGTSLRYDTTGSQFIFNWQTPKKPGTCYDVTVQMVDKSQIPIAKFLLK
jgi:hypothetical protein